MKGLCIILYIFLAFDIREFEEENWYLPGIFQFDPKKQRLDVRALAKVLVSRLRMVGTGADMCGMEWPVFVDEFLPFLPSIPANQIPDISAVVKWDKKTGGFAETISVFPGAGKWELCSYGVMTGKGWVAGEVSCLLLQGPDGVLRRLSAPWHAVFTQWLWFRATLSCEGLPPLDFEVRDSRVSFMIKFG